MADPFDLDRFVRAQDPVLDQVRRELGEGRKRSHWMWFVFPQLRGLGRSPTAQHYGIGSLAEAQAYLAHPVLGPRLVECTEMVNKVEGRSVHQIFGGPDDLKFHSSMTLFAAAPEAPVFREALGKHFAGALDAPTVEELRRA
ncbi:MAG: NTP pyrophosphohydrolases including oxidative damage repair enzymes [uncultured Solirubrobacteraceae bacterium]|uniref:NTP pyrophosphohydrolases including oxidative damage repair enzymes n=1 Tax=uncultured Solirubrobacteraceae bacterium TaxID=1162706 RepID=A0A6J4SUZ9_9ACTN|nr:MAG: NTP pyrophosphohydrolases including oxidative damage repair enzymes [uncultured Solirubrobacteraceae bacterium]